MPLQQYIRVLRARWMLVTASVMLGVVVAGVLAIIRPPTYAATTQLFLSVVPTGAEHGPTYEGALFVEERARSYADILSGPAGAQAVIDRLGLSDSPRDVQRKIHVAVPPDGVLINATATAEEPEKAMAMAHALAEQLPGLLRRLESSSIQATVTRPPRLPVEPIAPRRLAYLALGAFLGLVIGVAGVAMVDTFNRDERI